MQNRFENKLFKGIKGSHRRATYKGCGFDPQDLNRPHIGIANTFSESSPGHAHFRPLVEAIKSGIWQAGGIPFEFGSPSTCAEISIGATNLNMDLAMRDVVAASIELVTEIQHFNGLILTSSCDNIVPGTLLAAARLDIPAIVFTGGPMLVGNLDGKKILLGDVPDLIYSSNVEEKGIEEYFSSVEMSACPTFGSCPLMGTANTMQILTEALGMTLPGSSTIPGVYTDKYVSAHRTGQRIVEMVKEELKPSKILTREALLNTIKMDVAIGGSTNAVLHLIALARELGIELTLDDFDELSRKTPCILNIRQSGKYTVDDLHALGGVPAIFKQLEDLVDQNCVNVSGSSLKEVLDRTITQPNDIIRSLDNPISVGGLAILKGNIAEDGSVVRISSMSPKMYHFKGPARVFDNDEDAFNAVMNKKIQPKDVIIVRFQGPVGAPGMCEIMLTTDALIALNLDEQIALLTDGRFSGFNHGAIIGHIAPEAAVGGAFGLIREGDIIEVDIAARSINVLVSEEILQKRRKEFTIPEPKIKKGFMRTYELNCKSADKGAAKQNNKI